jgi:diadenosine tetraphosphate (Ap4A) HIT family hydrolase
MNTPHTAGGVGEVRTGMTRSRQGARVSTRGTGGVPGAGPAAGTQAPPGGEIVHVVDTMVTSEWKPKCVLCAGADSGRRTPLEDLLPAGRSRFIATTPRFVAVPTYGCFVPGYLLLIPRPHVLSFGQLTEGALGEAEALVEELAERLRAVYGLPVLGFEYGLATRGVRRIEHAHWHLLPSTADLAGFLDERLAGQSVASLAALPRESSYIAVRGQGAILRVYDVGDALTEDRRIRLRRTVAALDPRIEAGNWDWAENRCAELIRATVADLSTATGTDADQAARR